MINNIFIKGIEKAGSQAKLGELLDIPQQHVSAYKKVTRDSKRKPPDEVILKIAEFMGLDKGKTLYKAKLELDPDNADLWKWCARLESNQRPSASETYRAQQFIKFMYALLSLLNRQLQHIAHNPNGRISLSNQYHHALVNL